MRGRRRLAPSAAALRDRPREDLEALGIPVAHDLPGVGENLLDHPESVIVWETNGPIPENSAMDSDAGLFVRRDSGQPGPDLMFHFYQIPFTDNPERLGYQRPAYGVSMTPNIPKPRSRGRLYLTSADPSVKPALDFRYFTDEDDYDARTLVDGIRIAREIAAAEPLAGWLKRESAPAPRSRRRRTERVRPQGRAHRLPPGRHLQDGRRRRRTRRGGPGTQDPGPRRHPHCRRVRLPDHDRREPDDRGAHGSGRRPST